MGPFARWVLGVTGWLGAIVRAGLSKWVIELLGEGEKACPFENENWVSNVSDFQLLHGAHRPLGFWRYRSVVGSYLGGSIPTAWIVGRLRKSGPV